MGSENNSSIKTGVSAKYNSPAWIKPIVIFIVCFYVFHFKIMRASRYLFNNTAKIVRNNKAALSDLSMFRRVGRKKRKMGSCSKDAEPVGSMSVGQTSLLTPLFIIRSNGTLIVPSILIPVGNRTGQIGNQV